MTTTTNGPARLPLGIALRRADRHAFIAAVVDADLGAADAVDLRITSSFVRAEVALDAADPAKLDRLKRWITAADGCVFLVDGTPAGADGVYELHLNAIGDGTYLTLTVPFSIITESRAVDLLRSRIDHDTPEVLATELIKESRDDHDA
jgi:hypothetical protein